MRQRLIILSIALGFAAPAAGQSTDPQASAQMPRVVDYTSMWWTDGFPGVVEGAPWHRCTQSGRYAMVLDTETLQIPFFGAVTGASGYDQNAEAGGEGIWRTLPAADLRLNLTVDGKSYRCTGGGPWSRFSGPRLIESGRFFQRADVTDLVFTADDGTRLNVEARFETAAWPDRLALILAARPGRLPIPSGESSFGRVRGGFGLDGTNHFEIPPGLGVDSEEFTLEFWVFVPKDYQATKTSPWLVCGNAHEQADGNFGIMIRSGGVPQARLNIGGGRDNAHVLDPDPKRPLNIDAWNHLAISYDGDTLRLFANGRLSGEKEIGQKRVPVPGAIAFGRRQDNSGDGYRFRGVVDEIRFYDRAISLEELRLHFGKPEIERPALTPVNEWTFRDTGRVSMIRPSEQWNEAAMEIRLSTAKGELHRSSELPKNQSWEAPEWREVALAFNPVTFKLVKPGSSVTVAASEIPDGAARPVEYDATLGWHRVNLDGIVPIISRRDAEAQRDEKNQKNSAPSAALREASQPSNDAIERVKLVLSNPTDREQVARLMFEKTARGFRQRIGTPITGISAILRDRDGNPTGIPVQLSKNWHNDSEGGVHAGQWFHGITQVRLPPEAATELELTLAYGHWGGVPAASHAQLSLIGWGGNQLWDQSALGSWGESICYEPDQIQRDCTIMDVRPVMVRSMGEGKAWGWTSNVGGGDIFRLFNPASERVPHAAMQTIYHRQGPCLTEITYAGKLGNGITHSTAVSLARTDDIVRGIYRIRLDVNEPANFSRFVLFQIGADTYSSSGERRMALGNESGLLREWETKWGGDTYRSEPIECSGRVPWVSLHDAVPRENQKPGALANRGIVIRDWKARIGGKEAAPWVAERGLELGREKSSTLDILPPPNVHRLEPGDFVEATIEHLVMPQFAKDYYGPNEALRLALIQDENTWRMIHREAVGNDRSGEMEIGTLERLYPDVRIATKDDSAAFTLTGGLGYVPLTFTGLSSHRGYQLVIGEKPVDQSRHGNDFWQSDYDPRTRTWSRTYNVPIPSGQTSKIRLMPMP